MPTDKLLHLLVGIAIAAILCPLGIYVALGAVVVAAVGKELRDMRGHGTPEVREAVASRMKRYRYRESTDWQKKVLAFVGLHIDDFEDVEGGHI